MFGDGTRDAVFQGLGPGFFGNGALWGLGVFIQGLEWVGRLGFRVEGLGCRIRV